MQGSSFPMVLIFSVIRIDSVCLVIIVSGVSCDKQRSIEEAAPGPLTLRLSVFTVTCSWEISPSLKIFSSHWLCFRMLDLCRSSCWPDGGFYCSELKIQFWVSSSPANRDWHESALSQDALLRKPPSLSLYLSLSFSLSRSFCEVFHWFQILHSLFTVVGSSETRILSWTGI